MYKTPRLDEAAEFLIFKCRRIRLFLLLALNAEDISAQKIVKK